MNERHTAAFLLVMVLQAAGCQSMGPNRVAPDQFNYNEAIARAGNEQMLLNLVRLRYREVPVFLALSSVLTQYVYGGRVAVNASGGDAVGFGTWLVGGSGSISYIERPTLTYSPLTGSEFAQQLLSPIDSEMVFGLVQSGWPPEQLLSMTILRINDLTSVGQAVDPELSAERLAAFERVIELFIILARQGDVEMQRMDSPDREVRTLDFEESTDPETAELIAELKRVIGLDQEINHFRETTRLRNLEPDEVSIRVRSILDLMGFLARGVEVPPVHLEERRTVEPPLRAALRHIVPVRIRSSVDRPTDAFVTVRYHDHWFYIPHHDEKSKQAFGLLAYLYQLKAPHAPTAGPLLTVPTG